MKKRQYEEALQRYQEDHIDEVEIINLHKRCNKAGAKAGSRTGAKTGSKAPGSVYHLFLREQLDGMTGESRKNYHNIVSRRWKEIKEDPARLSAYSGRARQMMNDDPLVHHVKDDYGESCGKKNTETAQKSTKNSKAHRIR